MTSQSDDFLISRDATGDAYGLWRFDPASRALLTKVPLGPDARLPAANHLIAIGNYLLEWGPLDTSADTPSDQSRLLS